MVACVPLTMWSMRWPSGCPTLVTTPGIEARRERTSAMKASLLRSDSWKLTSISAPLVACECSSSSPRPVRREVEVTSGMERSSFSNMRPNLLLSSNEMPGLATAAMVREPSLNGGRKSRPTVNKRPMATNRSATVVKMTGRRWPKAHWSMRR